MHLIICVDERDGLSFCGRRLSRDSVLNRHILALTAGHKLWMHPDSAKLFSEEGIFTDEACLKKAETGEYCFLETKVPVHIESLESVILYCWNRAYPSTEKFPRQLLESMHLVHEEEFSGSSHEKITMQRYVL